MKTRSQTKTVALEKGKRLEPLKEKKVDGDGDASTSQHPTVSQNNPMGGSMDTSVLINLRPSNAVTEKPIPANPSHITDKNPTKFSSDPVSYQYPVDSQEWTTEKARKHLIDNWSNPKSSVSFLGTSRIYNFYSKTLSYSEIKEILSTKESWSLMKMAPRKSRKLSNKFHSYSTHDIWQADSCKVEEFSSTNCGIKHLLNVIDVFSRKAWSVGLFNLSAEEGIRGLTECFLMAGVFPSNLGSDKGIHIPITILQFYTFT